MTIILNDFYAANQWTPYPFAEEYQSVTRYVIDGMISVPGAYQGKAVLLTKLRSDTTSPRSIEIQSDSDVLIAESDAVSVTTFGAYELWHVASLDGRTEAQLVVCLEAPDVSYDGAGLEFVPNVVSFSAQSLVESLLSGAQEVAGSGEVAHVLPGSNIRLAPRDNGDGSSTLVISAAYSADGPCVPSELGQRPSLQSINGVQPDDYGNIGLLGSGIWLADGQAGGLTLRNVGTPCCDCSDYSDMFEKVKLTHERLSATKAWIDDALGRYKALLQHVKFALRTSIVGEYDPDTSIGPDVADCP